MYNVHNVILKNFIVHIRLDLLDHNTVYSRIYPYPLIL